MSRLDAGSVETHLSCGERESLPPLIQWVLGDAPRRHFDPLLAIPSDHYYISDDTVFTRHVDDAFKMCTLSSSDAIMKGWSPGGEHR